VSNTLRIVSILASLLLGVTRSIGHPANNDGPIDVPNISHSLCVDYDYQEIVSIVISAHDNIYGEKISDRGDVYFSAPMYRESQESWYVSYAIKEPGDNFRRLYMNILCAGGVRYGSDEPLPIGDKIDEDAINRSRDCDKRLGSIDCQPNTSVER
jgi:hypothetical protein